MTALAPFIGELPAEAVDALRGRLRTHEELLHLTSADLIEEGRKLGDHEMVLRLYRAMLATAALQDVGTKPTVRKQALQEFSKQIRYPCGRLQTDLRISRYLTLADLDRYPDLTPGHFHAAVHLTHRKGEAPDAETRQARVHESLALAQINSLTVKALKERLAKPLVIVDAPSGAPEAPEPGSVEDVQQRVEMLTAGLLERLTAAGISAPETATEIVAQLLSERLRGGAL